MKKQFLATIVCVAACALGSVAVAQDSLQATTQDGRKVILKSDGTWTYEAEAPTSPGASAYQAPATATATETFSRGNFRIRYNDNKWVVEKSPDGSKWHFALRDGEAYALVIPESFSASTNAMKKIALANLRKATSEFKIVKEEIRKVNGRDVLFMQVDATVKEIFFVYYYYIYGDAQGVIQVIAFTSPAAQAKYEPDIFNLLNGLEIDR